MNENESNRETHNSKAAKKNKPSHLKNHLDTLCKDVIHQSATAKFWLELLALIGLAVYASITFGQWLVMSGQLTEMTKQFNLQRRAAIEQYGVPNVNLLSWANPNAPLDQQQGRWFALYSVGEGKKPTAIFKIKNDGKGEAKSVAIAAKLEFRELAPKRGPNGYAFREDEFTNISNLSTFDPKRVSYGQPQPPDIVASFTESRPKPISSEEYGPYMAGRTALFVYGQIRYKNFMEEDSYYPFCYWLKATDVPDTGRNGEFLDCGQFKEAQ